MDILRDPYRVPLFFILFLFLYLLAYFLFFRNWPRDLRPEASSCFISLSHGTPAVVLAYLAIFSDQNQNFDGPNTVKQNVVLDYSTGYFLMDLLHYIIFHPDDYLFIAHHLATLFVIFTCRFIVCHGAFGILSVLILAEITSFLQNWWNLVGMRRLDVKLAAKLYPFLSISFYSFYSVVRGLIGPYFTIKMAKFYLSETATGVIPKWAWISWIVVIASAILISVLWVSNQWADFFRERSNEELKNSKTS